MAEADASTSSFAKKALPGRRGLPARDGYPLAYAAAVPRRLRFIVLGTAHAPLFDVGIHDGGVAEKIFVPDNEIVLRTVIVLACAAMLACDNDAFKAASELVLTPDAYVHAHRCPLKVRDAPHLVFSTVSKRSSLIHL